MLSTRWSRRASCRAVAVDVVSDQLGVAEDGIKRRAQLVAHVGQKLRLVLARFCKLPALVMDFVEQPHVLDRDHRLVGEGGDQLDLLVGERFHRASRQCNDADRRSFPQQRDAEDGAIAGNFRGLLWIFRIAPNIGDMNDFPSTKFGRQRSFDPGSRASCSMCALYSGGTP